MSTVPQDDVKPDTKPQSTSKNKPLNPPSQQVEGSASYPAVPEFPAIEFLPESPESLAQLVDKLEDLVKFTVECEKKELREDISFVDVYQQLMLIKQGVELLNEEYIRYLEAVAAQGATPASEQQLSTEEKHAIKRLSQLQDTCENAKSRIHASLQEHAEEAKQLTKEFQESQSSDQQKSRRRKAKFKGMDGKV